MSESFVFAFSIADGADNSAQGAGGGSCVSLVEVDFHAAWPGACGEATTTFRQDGPKREPVAWPECAARERCLNRSIVCDKGFVSSPLPLTTAVVTVAIELETFLRVEPEIGYQRLYPSNCHRHQSYRQRRVGVLGPTYYFPAVFAAVIERR